MNCPSSFLEVHKELCELWEAPFSARTEYTSSSLFTPLSLPCLSRAYNNAGQATSALHVMAILQVYQAKVLRDLHKWGPNTEMMQELQSVTDYALRAMMVTPKALGRTMSTFMVQEWHLWLNLMEMRDAEK